ncbi:MAG TPA: GNAT family N-acetyltransferase [Candidatus Babeliales bacterium]|nr:GNAT family N-acetyltransferase [Candidatus Babeliales bacterium]
MIQPVTDVNEAAALAYLARSPYLNVFISHILLHDLPPPARRNVAVALDGESVIGVAYYGRQLAISADPAALPAFGERAKRRRGERMIVGPRQTVRGLWEIVRGWHETPRLVRERQFVMAIDRARLRLSQQRVAVRHATPSEWRAVADASAQMIEQELAYDPRRGSPDFGTSIAQMVERKLWWVGVAGDRLCFFCNLGPWCSRTIQLQGIWTPPDLRGQGLATASLAAICDRLLEFWPTLSLYVNDFNAPAIALYRRVGFEHVGDFQTLLF